MPSDAAEVGCKLAEIGAHIRHAQKRTRERCHGIFKKPSQDNRVSDGDTQSRHRRHEAKHLPDDGAMLHAAHLQRLGERTHGTGAHRTPERHLADNAGEPQQHHENQIRNQVCRSAHFGHAVRKQPDAAQADRRANTRNNKSGLAGKRVASSDTARCVLCHHLLFLSQGVTHKSQRLHSSRPSAHPLHRLGSHTAATGHKKGPRSKPRAVSALIQVRDEAHDRPTACEQRHHQPRAGAAETRLMSECVTLCPFVIRSRRRDSCD